MTLTRVLETIPKRKLSIFGLAIKFLRDRDPNTHVSTRSIN